MKKADAIKHFGSAKALAAALNLTPAAISLWDEYPPALRQLQIERLSKKLKAEPGCLEQVLGLPYEPWDGKTERRSGKDRRKAAKSR